MPNLEKGKKEYDYFENSFGFENDYKLTATNQNICKFIYIRIPLVDIETQEYILACENKLSDNKSISLSYDDLFTLAILLKESNKEFVNYLSEKIDDNKVQIIEHSDDNTEKIMEHSDNNTEKIIDEIDKLGEQLKEFNISLENRRKNIQKELENAKDNDIKLEKIYNKFNHDSAEEIKNSVENCICEDDYNKEEKNLIKTLGESAWNKLSNQSKRFLISSKITFNTLYKLGDIIDYSGVCLLVTKALEVELTKRFYIGFYEYLEDNDMSFGEYHTSLVVNEYAELKKLPENRWTLGGIPYILCYKKHPNPEIHEKNVSILIEYSKEKLFRDLSDEEIRETLRKYGKEIKNLTYRYRNPAAHTNELQCRQAKQCLDYFIDVEHFLKIMLDSFDKEDDV